LNPCRAIPTPGPSLTDDRHSHPCSLQNAAICLDDEIGPFRQLSGATIQESVKRSVSVQVSSERDPPVGHADVSEKQVARNLSRREQRPIDEIEVEPRIRMLTSQDVL